MQTSTTTMPVKIAFFDAKSFDKVSFGASLKSCGYGDFFEFVYFSQTLNSESAELARGCQGVCCFVNDDLSSEIITTLAKLKVQLIVMRCAGFDRVDLSASRALRIPVCRVPAYSPNAIAEYAVALLMSLNRKVHTAYNRVRNNDFTIDGLVGFDLHGKTVGVVGTGKIGFCFAKIMLGFGCTVLAYDVMVNRELEALDGVTYSTLPDLLSQSDVVSLHAPLLPSTRHMINESTLKHCKRGAVLINTSRGGLVDAKALVDALVSGHIGGAGLDVYENESKYFFQNVSDQEMDDETLARLQNMRRVIITSHQAFLTREALSNISSCTIESLVEFFVQKRKSHELTNVVPAPAPLATITCGAAGGVAAARRMSQSSVNSEEALPKVEASA